MTRRRRLVVGLGYWKQGDDLADHLGNGVSAFKAFKAHAEQMRRVAAHLDLLAEGCDGYDVDIDAGTHHIGIECSQKLASKLVKAGLADYDPCEEEE